MPYNPDQLSLLPPKPWGVDSRQSYCTNSKKCDLPIVNKYKVGASSFHPEIMLKILYMDI